MTIRDVAEYCGVSVSTVSRVLNDRPDVRSDVRAKILEAIKELHYVPNNSARSLVSTSSANIGVIVRGGGNPFFTPIVQAIEHTINQRGYSMSIRHIPDTADEVSIGASLARSKRLAGIIFLGGKFDYEQERLNSLGIPALCCTFTNHFGSLPKDVCSSVSIDDRAEAANAVNLLIRNGHKKIAILLNDREDRSIGQLRFAGYCDALKSAGIKLKEDLICETGAYNLDAAYQKMNALLESNVKFTALFAIADSLAIAGMKAICEHGRRIPDDISVISIDGLSMSRFTVPTLTTLTQPSETLGQRSAETIIDVIEGKSPHRQIILDADLRVGGTVARAPK